MAPSALSLSKWLPRLSISSAIAVYILIVFGSRVRVSESGMGCPDWPLCDGNIGPIPEFHALMEQTHRYIAALVAVLVVLTALAARRTTAFKPALFTVGTVVVQILLGAVTVFASNGAPTVAAHLIAGLALLSGAAITAVNVFVPQRPVSGPRLGTIAWGAIVSAGVLYLSGSLVVNAEAEQACASFPFCPSDQPTDLIVLHLLHRGVAVLAGIALIVFAVHALREWQPAGLARPVRTLASTLVLSVALTAILGIASALMKAPPYLQDLHLAGAAAVLICTVSLATVGWLTGADSAKKSSFRLGRLSLSE